MDGSEPSKQALRWGLFLVQTTGAGLDAVMAWMIPAFAADVLHRTVTEVLGEQPPVPVREIVTVGGAARVLLEASKDPEYSSSAAADTAASAACCSAR